MKDFMGLIMVKGNHLNKINNIFKYFNYKSTGNDKELNKLIDDYDFISKISEKTSNKYISYKTVCLSQDWTVILDPEMSICTNEEGCKKTSLFCESPVFGMYCAETSYGFYYYDNGKKIRAYSMLHFDNLDTAGIFDNVLENFGKPLIQEKYMRLKSLNENKIYNMMKKFGVHYNEILSENNHIIKELEYNS